MTSIQNNQKIVLPDVYGCGFHMTGNGTAILEMLANDFRFFIRKEIESPVRIEVIESDPPTDGGAGRDRNNVYAA
ncbi:hypothetical protein ACFL1S_03250 [Pseudomonadota bacterium]